MASFIGTFEEFTKYISPRARNVVNGLSRNYKKEVGHCEECKSTTATLEAAHVTDRERPLIIEEILSDFINGEVVTVDLDVFESKFIAAHEPINQNIRVLCRPCHREYDANNELVTETTTEIEFDSETLTNQDAPVITNSEITTYLRQTVPSLSESIITKLLNADYCQQTFNVYGSVLKSIPFEADLEAIREHSHDEKGYNRWSTKNPIVRYDARYLVLTQWYDRNRLPFLKWRKGIENGKQT